MRATAASTAVAGRPRRRRRWRSSRSERGECDRSRRAASRACCRWSRSRREASARALMAWPGTRPSAAMRSVASVRAGCPSRYSCARLFKRSLSIAVMVATGPDYRGDGFPPFPNPSPKEGEGNWRGRGHRRKPPFSPRGRELRRNPLSPPWERGQGERAFPPFPNPSPKEGEGDRRGKGTSAESPSLPWEGNIGGTPSPSVGEGAGGEGFP